MERTVYDLVLIFDKLRLPWVRSSVRRRYTLMMTSQLERVNSAPLVINHAFHLLVTGQYGMRERFVDLVTK